MVKIIKEKFNIIKEFKKNRKYAFLALVLVLFVFIFGVSYAYFSSILTVEGGYSQIVTTTGELSLNFNDGPQVTMLSAYPGQYKTKTITIENTGTLDADYTIFLDDITNTITDDELVISGTCTSNTDTCEDIIQQPIILNGTQTLKGNISIGRDETHTYVFTILFKEMDKEQNYNQGKNFTGRIQVNEYHYEEGKVAVINNAVINNLLLTSTITDNEGIASYCITNCESESCDEWVDLDETKTSLTLSNISVDDYDKKLWVKNVNGNVIFNDLTPNPQLTVIPNGGLWEESPSNQTINLKYKETKDIVNPVREGYSFDDWVVSGERSELINSLTLNKSKYSVSKMSKILGGRPSKRTFKMGIENSTITANWNAIEYYVTINPNEGTWNGYTTTQVVGSDYETSINLPNPTRTGYTFTGWELSENTNCVISSESLTMGLDGCTITASWEKNDYPWIAYHNKQNVSGSGYTLVSADTEDGEAEFGTTVTPNTKTYTGFTSPSAQTITIQEEASYPPVNNIVNYNYARNKYTLTISPNLGSYNGTTANTVIENVYYDSTTNLQNPTRTGYNFSNWSITGTGSSVTGNQFKMGTTNTTIAAAWSPISMTLNYNSNGGNAVSPSSKTVTYNSTYGTLPTPTRSNYTFSGWYTAASGGTQVISTTKVTQTVTHTIYARWTPSTFTLTYNNNGGSSCTSKTVTNGSTYGELCMPSHSTKGFTGWYTAASGGTRIQSTSTVSLSANQTLYAHWTSYAVKYFCHWTNFNSCCALEPGVGEFTNLKTLCTEACSYVNSGQPVVFGPNETSFVFSSNTYAGYTCNCGSYTGHCAWTSTSTVLINE